MILKRQLRILYIAEGRRGIIIACCESLNEMDCKTCHEIAGKKFNISLSNCDKLNHMYTGVT